jgi:small conductance mechanosensitive channel
MHWPDGFIHIGDYFHPSTLPGALLWAVVFAIVAFYIARLVKLGFSRLIASDSGDRTVLLFLSQFASVIIYILALVFYVHLVPALNALGTALLTSVSIVSVVVGLAAQPTLGNMVSGIALLLYRPFHVGDHVQVTAPSGLETGVVESLSLGYTKLRTADNRSIIVPNSVMAGQAVINVLDKKTVGTADERR